MSGQGAGQLAQSRFDAAHRALLDDPAVQFDITRAPPPAQPPPWLKKLGEWVEWAFGPVGRLLRWIGSWMPDWPFARLFLWTVIALLAAAVLWIVVERVRSGEWRLPRWRRRSLGEAETVAEEPWIAPGPVRQWLEEADALAVLGRFAEAAHLLLLRAVEDLARRRPQLVRPALTARELAGLGAFPAAVRARFAPIVALVERSLFGGRAVDADDWQAARAAYAELATPGAWRG